MGQKITEYPQVDYWVKLTREADKAGARLPHRESSDRREVEKFGDMQRARFRSSFTVSLPASMLRGPDDPNEGVEDTTTEDGDDLATVEEGEDDGDGDAESA